MKQVVLNYEYYNNYEGSGSDAIAFTDFSAASIPVDLQRLYLITDVTINQILYNFADHTISTAVILDSYALVLTPTNSSASSSDQLQIIYEAESTDPIYEIPLLPANAAQETGGNLDAIADLLLSGVTVNPVGISANALTGSPLVGQAKISSTGTAVQLNSGTSQSLTNGIIISAPSTNSASISVGGSSVNNTANGTGNGYLLVPGASISFAVSNTNDLYINGTAGDFVSWAGS